MSDELEAVRKKVQFWHDNMRANLDHMRRNFYGEETIQRTSAKLDTLADVLDLIAEKSS